MESKKKQRLAFLTVILAAIFGGGIPVFGKIGLMLIPPITFTFFRFLIATVFLLPFAVKQRHQINRSIWKVILLSLLATANVTLFAFGIRWTTATTAQLLYSITPIISAFFSYYLLKEKISIKKIVGITIGFFGVLLVILLPAFNISDKVNTLNGNLSGNLIILIAVVIFSLYSIFSKKYQQELKVTPIFLTFLLTLTTTLVTFFFALYEYFLNPSWIANVSGQAVLSTFYVGIFGGAIFYLLYQYAIKNGTPIVASMTLFFQPIATFAWAFCLLNETLTIDMIFGGVLILLGAYIVTLKK